jgi:hypothetical protein
MAEARQQQPEGRRGILARYRPIRRRATSALVATAATIGIGVAAIAGSAPAGAQHLTGKTAARANLASYQQFAVCMRGRGFAQWPDANPARPSVFAVAPQAAVGAKQRLGQAARDCSATVGNGDITLVH